MQLLLASTPKYSFYNRLSWDILVMGDFSSGNLPFSQKNKPQPFQALRDRKEPFQARRRGVVWTLHPSRKAKQTPNVERTAPIQNYSGAFLASLSRVDSIKSPLFVLTPWVKTRGKLMPHKTGHNCLRSEDVPDAEQRWALVLGEAPFSFSFLSPYHFFL